MVLVTTVIGFYLGNRSFTPIDTLFCLLLGSALCSGGASALNQYLERDTDKLMRRTCMRPIPTGKIVPQKALSFGIILVLAGVLLLTTAVNLLTGFLSVLTAFLYVLVYTPLKKTTWLNTVIGAIPGALPPMGGYAAATNDLGLGAWILFLILFLWQHPHFYAIAWMYREDYQRGGLKMLPVVEPDGRKTFGQIIVTSLLLIAASILPYSVGLAGVTYLIGALISGFLFVAAGIVLAKTHTTKDARRVLQASIGYLPILLTLIILDVR
jgi:protoheme IX farnesyltransferase